VPKSGFDQSGEPCEAIASRRGNDTVIIPLEQGVTKRALQLVQLFAECGLADIRPTRGGRYAANAVDQVEIMNLPQADDRALGPGGSIGCESPFQMADE
jgi:hypothetical protein